MLRYDLRTFTARSNSAIGLRLLELLLEGRHTREQVVERLHAEPPVYNGVPVQMDADTFSFWTSETRSIVQGRLHGYHAYKGTDGVWHVEERDEPATKPPMDDM